MVNIYLKYGTYSGSTLMKSSALSITTHACTKRIVRKIVVNDTLRKRKSVNKSLSRTYYDCKFGAAALTTSMNMTWFETFFKADYWELSLDGIDYFQIVFDDEEFNLEYLNDSIYLPEWKVKFYKVEAD